MNTTPNIFRRTYLQFRWWLGKHEQTLWTIRLRKDLSHLLVTKDSHLLIEGFPRSGNTFAEVAFSLAQKPERLNIATHLHLPAHIKRAVRLHKPCLILIRPPKESIASLWLYYYRNYPALQAVKEYIDFYSQVLEMKDYVLVSSFNAVRQDFGIVINKLNKRYGTSFKPFEHTECNVQLCFKIIAERARNKYGESAASLMRLAAPSRKRECWKEEIIKELSLPPCRRYIEEAETIYDALTQDDAVPPPHLLEKKHDSKIS